MYRSIFLFALLWLAGVRIADAQKHQILERDVAISDAISLRVAECGMGPPVIFVHGSVGDHTVWHEHLPMFAGSGYRAIAYSRRYNWPNKNDREPNHSAIVEADDLLLLADALQLDKFHLVGHSYGGYTALIFSLHHPSRLRSVTLAEPPIAPWLKEITGNERDAAIAHYSKLYDQFILPARREFNAGSNEKALRVFLDAVAFENAIDVLPKADVDICRRNIAELQALVESHNSFPLISKLALKENVLHVLLVSGGNSNDVGKYTDPYLMKLLNEDLCERTIVPDANHIMWKTHPKEVNSAILAFLNRRDEQSDATESR